MHVVFVEGGIGVGKSTALKGLREVAGAPVVLEDVSGWTLWGPSRFDPARHSFAFQIEVCMSMYDQIDAAIQKYQNTHTILYCERSILSSLIFGKMACDKGYMLESEYNLLEKTARRLHALLCFGHNTSHILFHCHPATALGRIRDRARKGEESLTLNDIAKLQTAFAESFPKATKISTESELPNDVSKTLSTRF